MNPFHWIAHKTNRNYGHVVTWEDDSYLYLGFECDKCGTVDEKTVHKVDKELVLGKPIDFGDE